MGTGSLLALGAAALAAGAVVFALTSPAGDVEPALAASVLSASPRAGGGETDLPRHLGLAEGDDSRSASASVPAETVPEPSARQEVLADTARQGWWLSGVVVDRASAGRTYHITCRHGEFQAQTTTDGMGAFGLQVPESGDYWFSVEAPGRKLMTHREVPGPGTFLRLEFEGRFVRGRVVDARGGPLEGVDVRLEWKPDDDEASIAHFPTQAGTDELGQFVFEYVPAGRFRLRANGLSRDGQRFGGATGEPFVIDDFALPEEQVLRLSPIQAAPAGPGGYSDSREFHRRRRRSRE